MFDVGRNQNNFLVRGAFSNLVGNDVDRLIRSGLGRMEDDNDARCGSLEVVHGRFVERNGVR